MVSTQSSPDVDSLSVWRSCANVLNTLTINEAPDVLRVARENERMPYRLQCEVALLDWIHEQGWQAPFTNASRISTKTLGGQTFHVVWAYKKSRGMLRGCDRS